MVRMVMGVVSKERQLELLEEIREHGGDKADLETVAGLREFVKEADVILRHPKSGSVPSLNEIITAEQRQLLIAEVLPAELRDDEKTMWYLGKLDDIGGCSMIPVEKYLSNKKSLKHKCFICGYEVDASPSRVETNAKKDRRGCDGCNHRNGTSLEDAQRLFRYKRPSILPLKGYVTKQDLIDVRCLVCGHEWQSRSNYLLLDGPGQSGCPECGKKRSHQGGNKRKSTRQFKEELSKISPNISVLGEYKNNNTKIRVRHNTPECGHEWEASPSKLLIGQGCPICNRPHMTHEDYLKKLNEQGIAYEPLAEFSGVDAKLPHRCPECGGTWNISPYNVLLGYGCPVCRAGRVNFTDEEFLEAVHKIDMEITPLDSFQGMQKKIPFRCERCGHTWNTIPYVILKPSPNKKNQNVCCPQCLHRTPQISEDEVKAKIETMHKHITLTSGYKGVCQKAWFKCDNHTPPYEWEAFVNNILRGTGCPKCNRFVSFPEKALFYYLSRDINYEVLINPKIEIPKANIVFEADIFIPDKKLFIEYDGMYWHDIESVMSRYEQREQAIYSCNLHCIHILEEDSDGNRAEGDWIREVPLTVDMRRISANYLRQALDDMILQLEERLDIIPQDKIACHNDMRAIEEFYEKNYTFRRIIIENDAITMIDKKNKE